jgi:NADH-quinone oxidoreductase subunit N
MNSIIIITILAVVLLFLGVYKKASALLPVAVLGLLGALAFANCYLEHQFVLFQSNGFV